MKNEEKKQRDIYVVLVDDMSIILRTYERSFNAFGTPYIDTDGTKYQFKCTTFNNPEEALSAIKENNPHIVITDYDMKADINGLQLIEKVNAINPAIPCILHTTIFKMIEKEVDAMGGIVIEKPTKSFNEIIEGIIELVK